MTLTKIGQSLPALNLSVVRVLGEKHAEQWKVVTHAFKTMVEPLYGDQAKILTKIQLGKDRECRVLLDGKTPVGCLVYRGRTSDKYKEFGIKNSLQIKFLLLFNQSGRNPTYFNAMLNVIHSKAKELQAQSIHVKVHEKFKDSYSLFKANGFVAAHTFKEDQESLIYKKTGQIDSIDKEVKMQAEKSVQKKRKLDEVVPPSNKRQKVDGARPPFSFDTIPLRREYMDSIMRGEKVVEGRINAFPFDQLKKNTTISFINGERTISCDVVEITKYKSWREMLLSEGVSNCLGRNVTHPDEGVSIYESIPKYEERAQKYGVLGIRLKYRP
jgi:ASC-1-like (ASCH) protein